MKYQQWLILITIVILISWLTIEPIRATSQFPNTSARPISLQQEATETPVPGAVATPIPGQPIEDDAEPGWSLGSNPLFCANQYWWVPGLLLPLLFVLLALLLLWWWGRRRNIDWGYEWQIRSFWCRLAWLALLLYTLFFIFLVGRELVVPSCQSQEAIYFWRMDGFQRGIYVSAPGFDQTPEPFRAVNEAGCVGCHAVSSTGGKIAVGQEPVPGHGFIKTLSGETVPIPAIDPIYMAWAPDGNKLAYSAVDENIYILDLEQQVTYPLRGASDPDVAETMPAWSSDGQTIAFVRTGGQLSYALVINTPSDIYTVPAIGGQPQPLTGASGSGFNYYPSYSPDGKWLAFTHHDDGSSSYADAAAEIYLVEAQGGTARRLAANDAPNGERLTGVSNSWPSWSKDGQILAFNSKRYDENFDIFITLIDAEGNSAPAQPLTGASQPGAFEHTPFWGAPPAPAPLLGRLFNLWPWLLPFIPLILLVWWLCRSAKIQPPPPPPPPASHPEPDWLAFEKLAPAWKPTPTLIIGLGQTGHWVLTYLKKRMMDANAQQASLPDGVRLLAIDTDSSERDEANQKQIQYCGIALNETELFSLGMNLRSLMDRLKNDNQAEFDVRDWLIEYQDQKDSQLDVTDGTSGARPLGRAALQQSLTQTKEEGWGSNSALFKRLATEIRAAMFRPTATEQPKVRIVLVSSLAGGTGSAILGDIAYLARQAAIRNQIHGGIVVEGYLLGPSDVSHADTMRVNSAAALRELSRFQLSGSRPYPLFYKSDSTDPILRGYCQSSWFDRLHLVDTPNFLQGQPAKQGVLPAVADMIALNMDPITYEAGNPLSAYRGNYEANEQTVQTERAEPVLGTFGNFGYNLPFFNIWSEVQYRLATEILNYYLSGQKDSRQLPSEIKSVNENYFQDKKPIELAQELIGWSCYGRGKRLVEIWEIFWWVQKSDAPYRPRHLLLVSEPEEIEAYASQYLDSFVTCTTILLNGLQESSPYLARCGKLVWTLSIVKEAQRQLALVADKVASLPNHLSGGTDKQKAQAVATLFDQLQKGVEGIYQDLDKQKRLISGSQESVYTALEDWQSQIEKTKQEMADIRTRGYLWSKEIVDTLYSPVAKLIDQGVIQLYWRLFRDEQDKSYLRLTVRIAEKQEIMVDLSNRLAFVSLLGQVANLERVPIWQNRDKLLNQFFNDKNLLTPNPTNLSRSDLMIDRSRHLADYDNALAHNIAAPLVTMQYYGHNFLGYPNPLSRDQILNQIQASLGQTTPLARFEMSDPFCCLLARLMRVVPLSAFNLYHEVNRSYAANLGVGGNPLPRGVRPAKPPHIFAAERNALQLERRWPEINETHWPPHPLFVANLEYLERATIFARALLANRLQQETVGTGEYIYRLQLRQGNFPLGNKILANSPEAQLLVAMRIFVLGVPNNDPAHTHFNLEDLAEKTQQDVDDHPEAYLERLKRLDEARYIGNTVDREQAFMQTLPGYLRTELEEQKPGSRDLRAFVRWVAYLDYQRLIKQSRRNDKENENQEVGH